MGNARSFSSCDAPSQGHWSPVPSFQSGAGAQPLPEVPHASSHPGRFSLLSEAGRGEACARGPRGLRAGAAGFPTAGPPPITLVVVGIGGVWDTGGQRVASTLPSPIGAPLSQFHRPAASVSPSAPWVVEV